MDYNVLINEATIWFIYAFRTTIAMVLFLQSYLNKKLNFKECFFLFCLFGTIFETIYKIMRMQ